MRTVTVVVSQIVSRIDHNELDLSPDFQRMRGIWSSMQKSRFIESLLLRIPIPMFYVAEDEDDRWIVIDGIQRISTVFDYVKGKFWLNKLEYLPYELHYFDHLPPSLRRRISETQLSISVVEPETPEEVRYNIFRRINTGGMLLNSQELRHALYRGPVRGYLQELSATAEFLAATRKKMPRMRMKDRESVLRFLAFRIKRWNRYASDDSNDFQEYLNNTMGEVNRMDDDRRRDLAIDFRNAMTAATRIFKECKTSVCQVPSRGEWQRFRQEESENYRAVSPALFEAWSVSLSRCTRPQIDTLVQNRDDLIGEFMLVLDEDRRFLESIISRTGHPHHVRKRFETIEHLIKEHSRDD